MIKISIIIPVYNVEKYLATCLDSVINQTYKNLEILLIDDGSTDSSGLICEQYSKKDTRIKTIHKKNGGLSDARNVGISYASGDYISFIDSDDFIDINTFTILNQYIKQYNADIITFNYYDYYNKDKISPHLLFNNLKFYAQQEFHSTFAKDLFNKYEMNVTAWNKVYKRKIFNNIKFPYGKLFEDTFSDIYILNQCNNILVIPDTLYYYRRRNDSIIGKHIQEKKYNIINIDSIEAKIMSAVDFYIFANHNKESTEMLFRILKNSLDDILFSANRNQYKNYELALIYLLKNLYKKPQLSLKIKFGILKRCFNIELYRRLIILFKK